MSQSNEARNSIKIVILGSCTVEKNNIVKDSKEKRIAKVNQTKINISTSASRLNP